jgi:hypothetical protein
MQDLCCGLMESLRGKKEGGCMTPENAVKGEILVLLRGVRMFFMRLQSGVVRVRGGMMHLCPIGTADFVVYPEKGFQVGWIEVKQLKGIQRKSQIEFQAKAEAAGHPYLIARSADDVENWLKERKAL